MNLRAGLNVYKLYDWSFVDLLMNFIFVYINAVIYNTYQAYYVHVQAFLSTQLSESPVYSVSFYFRLDKF